MRILVVDDEQLARKRLIRLLNQQGEQTILEAGHGLEALDQCEVGKFDIVFLDIRMPGIDGLHVSKRIRKIDPAIKIVFTTAYDRYALNAFDSHAAGYLLKPIDAEKLKGLLVHLFGDKKVPMLCFHHQAKLKLDVDKIACCYADSKYVTVLFQQQSALTNLSLKKILHQWPNNFVQIHRNTLINPKYLLGLKKTAQGHRVRLHQTEYQPVISRRLLKWVKQQLEVN